MPTVTGEVAVLPATRRMVMIPDDSEAEMASLLLVTVKLPVPPATATVAVVRHWLIVTVAGETTRSGTVRVPSSLDTVTVAVRPDASMTGIATSWAHVPFATTEKEPPLRGTRFLLTLNAEPALPTA